MTKCSDFVKYRGFEPGANEESAWNWRCCTKSRSTHMAVPPRRTTTG